MHARGIRPGVKLIASVHWERRLFDALIPLPDGTSYNAYFVEDSTATALVDTTDPELRDTLLDELDSVSSVDYVVSLPSEHDHSRVIPDVLARFPTSKAICSKKAQELLMTQLHVAEERIRVVEDSLFVQFLR